MIRHLREDLTDIKQLLGRVAIDLYDQGFVGYIEVPLDNPGQLAVLLDHVVQHDCIGHDSRGPAIQPFGQVLGIASQPDSRTPAVYSCVLSGPE